MPIPIHCPLCGKQYKLRDDLAGKRVKCKCGHGMLVPRPATGTESDTYDVAPAASQDPMSSLLEGELPPVQGPVLRAPARGAAAASSEADREKEGGGKGTKRGASSLLNSPRVAKLGLAGLTVLPVIVVAVVVWLILRPGFGSPEDAFKAHQDALLKRNWKALISTYSPESRRTILCGVMEVLSTPTEQPAEILAVFQKYGVEAAMEKEAPAETPAEASADSPAETAAESTAEAAAATAATQEAEKTSGKALFADYAERARQRRERLQKLVAGVKNTTAFYAELMAAVEAIKMRNLPENPLLAVFTKKPEGNLRRAVAASTCSDVEVDGDTATATITYTEPGDEEATTAPVAFKRVGGRWYLHLSGPDDFDASPFRDLMGGTGIAWML